MSQEERSELSTEPVSDLSGEETETAEVNTEDSDNYAWDNYREDPSFVEKDPEEEDLNLEREITVPRTGRRASSTDHQFLEDTVPPVIKPFIFSLENQDSQYAVWPPRHLSSESDLAPEENLLPTGLLDCINEEVEEVFFDANLVVEAERMPPKAAPTIEQLFASFTEKVKQFDRRKRMIDRLGDQPSSEALGEMFDLNQAIEKLAMDMERTNHNFASDYPDVEGKNDRIFDTLELLRRAKSSEICPAADARTREQEIDSAVASLDTEFKIWKKGVIDVEEKMLKIIEDNPTPSSFEVGDMKRFLEKLQTTEKTAESLYIKLAVEIAKYSEEQKRKEIN